MIEYILGEKYKEKIEQDTQYIIIQESQKKYVKSKKIKSGKKLKVNSTHLYFYSEINDLFTLKDESKIKKYKSTKPYLQKFQINQLCLFLIIDLQNNLIFYNINDLFFQQKPTSKIMEKIFQFLNRNMKYQDFNEKMIPMFIEKYELYNSTVLYINYELTSESIVEKLIYNDNKVYITSSPYLHYKGNYAVFKNVILLLKNNKFECLCKTVTFINNHKDYILKTIEILRLLIQNNEDLSKIFNLKESLQEQIDKFSFEILRDLSKLNLQQIKKLQDQIVNEYEIKNKNKKNSDSSVKQNKV